MRTHIDYWDIIYDQPSNESFCEKLESVQYEAALTIAVVVQSLSKEELFMELGQESLKSRRNLKRLCCMFTITKDQTPEYLNKLIPKRKQNFNTRNKYILGYNCEIEFFKPSFSHASLEESFHLDPSIINSESINTLKQRLLSFIRPLENSIFNIFDP